MYEFKSKEFLIYCYGVQHWKGKSMFPLIFIINLQLLFGSLKLMRIIMIVEFWPLLMWFRHCKLYFWSTNVIIIIISWISQWYYFTLIQIKFHCFRFYLNFLKLLPMLYSELLIFWITFPIFYGSNYFNCYAVWLSIIFSTFCSICNRASS